MGDARRSNTGPVFNVLHQSVHYSLSKSICIFPHNDGGDN